MAGGRDRVAQAQARLRAAVAEREADEAAGVGRHERQRRAGLSPCVRLLTPDELRQLRADLAREREEGAATADPHPPL